MPKYSFPVCDISPDKIFLCYICPHSFLVCDSCSDIVFCIRYLHRHRCCVWGICPYIVFLPVISAQTSGPTVMYQVNAKMNSQFISIDGTRTVWRLYTILQPEELYRKILFYVRLCARLLFLSQTTCVCCRGPLP